MRKSLFALVVGAIAAILDSTLVTLAIHTLVVGAALVPPMSVAYQDIQPANIPHATINTRLAQQVGASFGTAIVAVALQSLLAHGEAGAFHGAFW